jgi:hypothetical protein
MKNVMGKPHNELVSFLSTRNYQTAPEKVLLTVARAPCARSVKDMAPLPKNPVA